MLKNIRKLRKIKNLSQWALAKESGVNRTLIQLIEAGYVRLKPEIAIRLLRVLGTEDNEIKSPQQDRSTS